MRNIKLESTVYTPKMRVIHKRLMRIQQEYTTQNVLGICLFIISILFVCADLLTLQTNVQIPAYSFNQAFALVSFSFSAYFCFVSRFNIKHPDFVFSAYALQFLFILFVWLFRFNQAISGAGM